MHHIAIFIFLISTILSLLVFYVYEKQYNNLSCKIKILIIFTTLFFMGIFIETLHQFVIYPTIAVTEDYEKALAIQKINRQKVYYFC